MDEQVSLTKSEFDSSFAASDLKSYSRTSYVFFGLSALCFVVLLTLPHFYGIEKVVLAGLAFPLLIIFALLGLYARLNLKELREHNRELHQASRKLGQLVYDTYGISLTLDEAQVLLCNKNLPLNVEGKRVYLYLSFLTDGTDGRLVYTDTDKELTRLDQIAPIATVEPEPVKMEPAPKKTSVPRKPRAAVAASSNAGKTTASNQRSTGRPSTPKVN
jgi:hypothetical protein